MLWAGVSFLDQLFAREFAAKYDQLHAPTWSCALTGKPGLTYEAALKSEQTARAQLKSFPSYFIGPVLQLVQHSE